MGLCGAAAALQRGGAGEAGSGACAPTHTCVCVRVRVRVRVRVHVLQHMCVPMRISLLPLTHVIPRPDILLPCVTACAATFTRPDLQVAMAVMGRQVTGLGPLADEWAGLLEALSPMSGAGRISFGSSRLVSLLRPRSCTILQQAAGGSHSHGGLHSHVSGEVLHGGGAGAGIGNSPSRAGDGGVSSLMSAELLRPMQSAGAGGAIGGGGGSVERAGGPGAPSGSLSMPVTGVGGRVVVDSCVDTPLQQLDAMVSSIQSTLSAVQLEAPGGGTDV